MLIISVKLFVALWYEAPMVSRALIQYRDNLFKSLKVLYLLVVCSVAWSASSLAETRSASRPCARAVTASAFTVLDRLSDAGATLVLSREVDFKHHIESQGAWGRLRADLPYREEMERHLAQKNRFPSPLRKLWADKTKFIEWSIQLRNDVLEEMIRNGKTSDYNLRNPNVWAYYLDVVLLSRAIFEGFTHDRFRFFELKKFELSNKGFNQLQAEMKIFDDIIGTNITGYAGQDSRGRMKERVHLRRGHAIVMVYAAENWPGFLNFYANLGKTGDPHEIWLDFFDNAKAGPGLMWPGEVVENIQRLMPIPE